MLWHWTRAFYTTVQNISWHLQIKLFLILTVVKQIHQLHTHNIFPNWEIMIWGYFIIYSYSSLYSFHLVRSSNEFIHHLLWKLEICLRGGLPELMWELNTCFRATLLWGHTWLCKWQSVFTALNLSFDYEFWRIEAIMYSISISITESTQKTHSRSNRKEETVVIESCLVILLGTQLSIHIISIIFIA